MQIFANIQNINFMGKRNIAFAISGILIAISVASLFVRGLNFGLDFSGGTLIELGYTRPVDLPEVRNALEKNGFPDAVAQHFGTSQDILVRLAPKPGENNAELSSQVLNVLQKSSSDKIDMRRVEFVGPQVGDELAEDGGLAVLYALVCIFIYVFFRFEWRFAAGSVLALFHDVLITLGVFSLFQLEFDLTVLAACLAVIGYSLNDTIVVFDRIRENFRKIRKGDVIEIANVSLNQTLSRTTMTSFTTLLVLVALFIFGGEIIHGFATALIIGIVVGTYSSIYIASSAAIILGVSRADMIPVVKEGASEGPGDLP